MQKIINRTAVVRSVTDEMKESRQAEFVISSEAVDRHRTVFKLDGWNLENYNRNSVVTYNHSLRSENPDNIIGTSEVFVEGNELIGRVTFESEDINPLAEKIRKKVNAGTLKMASIAALPSRATFGDKEKGEDASVLYFREQELVEWSIVPAGSNPDAYKRNKENIEAYKNEITKSIEVEKPEVVEGKSVFEAQLIINKNK